MGPPTTPEEDLPDRRVPPEPELVAGAAPLELLEEPPPFSEEQLDEQTERFLKGVELAVLPSSPALGELGSPIVAPDPRRERVAPDELLVATLSRDADAGPVGRRVQSYQTVFARPPVAAMDEAGGLALRFETTVPAPSVTAYYGTVTPQGALLETRLRKQSRRSISDQAGLLHRIDVPAAALLDEPYDIHDTRHTGRGWVAWRVEVLDLEHGSARVFDGVTPFRCEPIPCARGARYVQLPAFRLSPQVDRVGADRATVSLATDVPTQAVVLVQAAGDEIQRFSGSRADTRHEIELRGLVPQTRYRYQVLAVDARGEVTRGRGATFRTAPATDDTAAVSFVALSDARSGVGSADEHYAGTNRRVLRQLLARGLERNPDFFLFVGDLVDGYTTEVGVFRFELEAWLETVAPVAAFVPIYEAMGNHEALVDAWTAGWAIGKSGEDSAEAVFGELFVNPRNGPEAEPGAPPYRENVYSFDYGMVHVAIVNSNYWWRSHPDRKDHPAVQHGQREGWVNDAILEWLDQDLKSAHERGARHLFVGTHEPGFPNGGHVGDAMFWDGEIPEVLRQRDKFFRVLARHGVSIFFCGDEHNYSRTRVDERLVPGLARPVWQVTSGGAGAPYYAQNRRVPWVENVAQFDVRQHLVLVRAVRDGLTVEVVAITGEVIDRFELAALAD